MHAVLSTNNSISHILQIKVIIYWHTQKYINNETQLNKSMWLTRRCSKRMTNEYDVYHSDKKHDPAVYNPIHKMLYGRIVCLIRRGFLMIIACVWGTPLSMKCDWCLYLKPVQRMENYVCKQTDWINLIYMAEVILTTLSCCMTGAVVWSLVCCCLANLQVLAPYICLSLYIYIYMYIYMKRNLVISAHANDIASPKYRLKSCNFLFQFSRAISDLVYLGVFVVERMASLLLVRFHTIRMPRQKRLHF